MYLDKKQIMKILWISHILPYPPKGGVMQRSYNLIKEVAKENEVYLFAFNQKAWLPTKEAVSYTHLTLPTKA